MEGKFRAITQVSCALLLVLSLSLVTALSVMADESPSISPTTAEYDLADPAEIIIAITWSTASDIVAIADDEGYLKEGLGKDYIVLVKNLIILNTYLEDKLTDIGESADLTIEFDVGDLATFNITASGTQPSISPTTAEYDLASPADVKTTITWGTATSIISIVDGDGYTLTEGTKYTITHTTPGVSANLTILNSQYLAGKLTDIGDEVVLTIEFNAGHPATFTITAIGTLPSISPTTAEYDLASPDNVKTTITWGTATKVLSIVDDDGYTLKAGKDYTLVTYYDTAYLTILSDPYLADKFMDPGDKVVLTTDFDVGKDATLTITVLGMCFIATAAYGTPMAEEIQILRGFRDEYLLTNLVGQALVNLYYRVSPPMAEFINEHPSLKPIVRAGLVPAVAMSVVAVNTTPAEKAAIIGLVVLVSVALDVWASRRRRRGLEYT